jgi:hypothetical protein
VVGEAGRDDVDDARAESGRCEPRSRVDQMVKKRRATGLVG